MTLLNEDVHMGMRPHTRNDNIRERLKVENITEVQERKTEEVWPRKEAIPRLHRKKDSGDHMVPPGRRKEEDRSTDGWTMSMKTRKLSEQEKMKSMTELAVRRIVSAAATPQPSGSG